MWLTQLPPDFNGSSTFNVAPVLSCPIGGSPLSGTMSCVTFVLTSSLKYAQCEHGARVQHLADEQLSTHMASTEEEACLDITDRRMEGKRHNTYCAMVFNTYCHNSCQAEYKKNKCD